jgi:hypothetical protein
MAGRIGRACRAQAPGPGSRPRLRGPLPDQEPSVLHGDACTPQGGGSATDRRPGLLTAGPGPATHSRRPRARSGGQHDPTPRPDSARRWPTPPFERSQPDADTPPTETANSRATTAFKRRQCRLGSVPHGAAPLADGDIGALDLPADRGLGPRKASRTDDGRGTGRGGGSVLVDRPPPGLRDGE